MNDWQDQYIPRDGTTSDGRRAPYEFAVVIAICLGGGFALMMGIMVAVKTIPQAAQDCAEYCEQEMDE